MPDYIDIPIDTDPQDILNDAYTYLQANIPGWLPAAGNLDVWLLSALAAQAAETRDVASAVPRSIFRWFGANLIGLAPVDATPATSTVKITMIDNAGYIVPGGTQVSIDAPGDTPVAFVTIGDAVVPGGSTFAAAVPIQAVEPGADSSGLGSVNGPVNLEDPITFVLSITLNAVTTGGTDAESDDDYLNRLTQQLTLLAPRPILPADFAIFARNIAGVSRAVAIDGYNPIHNLLTANEASVETDVTGWAASANVNISQTGAQFADGIKSLQMSSVAAGDMSAINAVSKTVTPGDTITVLASARTAVSVRSVKVGIQWRDAADALLSTVQSAGVNDSAAAWTALSYTAVAPNAAVKARIIVTVVGTGAAAEVHYFDKMSMRRGSGTDWVPGGTAETGNPRTVAEAAIDSLGNPVSTTVKNAILADAQSRREVNFIVNVIDPVITSIDVTYTVKMLAGFDAATVIANVNAALQSYLNPATWGIPAGTTGNDWQNATMVRYLEIAQIINGADGVDYITTTAGNYDLTIGMHGGTMARVDVLLAGAAPLPTAGTLTGTAN